MSAPRNDARITMLLILPLLIAVPFALAFMGGLGEVEMTIWLAMLAIWAIVFTVLGRRRKTALTD